MPGTACRECHRYGLSRQGPRLFPQRRARAGGSAPAGRRGAQALWTARASAPR